MIRRIEIRFVPVDFTQEGVRYVEAVTVTESNETLPYYDLFRGSRPGDLYAAAHEVETLLRSGRWRVSFPEILDRAPMVYDCGVGWKRLVAYRTDLVIEEISA